MAFDQFVARSCAVSYARNRWAISLPSSPPAPKSHSILSSSSASMIAPSSVFPSLCNAFSNIFTVSLACSVSRPSSSTVGCSSIGSWPNKAVMTCLLCRGSALIVCIHLTLRMSTSRAVSTSFSYDRTSLFVMGLYFTTISLVSSFTSSVLLHASPSITVSIFS